MKARLFFCAGLCLCAGPSAGWIFIAPAVRPAGSGWFLLAAPSRRPVGFWASKIAERLEEKSFLNARFEARIHSRS
jgi:hypothetical protein